MKEFHVEYGNKDKNTFVRADYFNVDVLTKLGEENFIPFYADNKIVGIVNIKDLVTVKIISFDAKI